MDNPQAVGMQTPFGVAIDAVHHEIWRVVEHEAFCHRADIRLVVRVAGIQVARQDISFCRDRGNEIVTAGTGLSGGVEGGEIGSPQVRGKPQGHLVNLAIDLVEQILLDGGHGSHTDAKKTEGDDNEIAMKLPEEFSHRDPLGYDEEDNYHTSKEKVLFKRLDVSNHNEMLCSVRKLVPEQRIAFDKVIQFCKNLKKSLDGKNRAPIPPLLMIHGGAGSGKSTIIHEIAKWAEYTLRKSGDNPDQPYVIKLAPTGMAASNINGATIHSAFSFVFSNEFTSLSDKKRKTHT